MAPRAKTALRANRGAGGGEEQLAGSGEQVDAGIERERVIVVRLGQPDANQIHGGQQQVDENYRGAAVLRPSHDLGKLEDANRVVREPGGCRNENRLAVAGSPVHVAPVDAVRARPRPPVRREIGMHAARGNSLGDGAGDDVVIHASLLARPPSAAPSLTPRCADPPE